MQRLSRDQEQSEFSDSDDDYRQIGKLQRRRAAFSRYAAAAAAATSRLTDRKTGTPNLATSDPRQAVTSWLLRLTLIMAPRVI